MKFFLMAVIMGSLAVVSATVMAQTAPTKEDSFDAKAKAEEKAFDTKAKAEEAAFEAKGMAEEAAFEAKAEAEEKAFEAKAEAEEKAFEAKAEAEEKAFFGDTATSPVKVVVELKKIRRWTGYFIVDHNGDYPVVLIYIGKQRCDDETINWKQMREATEDWITYQTDYTRERGGRDVYTVEVRQPTGLFFNRIVVIPNDSWPIVEAKIDNCRMEVSVIELMTGGEVCVRGHCGRLHKAVLDGGIKPLSSIEDCVWLHPTEK